VLAQQREDEDRFDREYACQEQPMMIDEPSAAAAPPQPPAAAAAVPAAPVPRAPVTPSHATVPLGGLKHRLLSYLHRQASASGDAALRHFFVCIEQYSNLLMWKMQLLDEQHVLIKFGALDSIVGRMVDFSTHSALFVVYNTQTTDIVGVFTNASEHLFSQFENFCDFFRASFTGQPTVGTASTSNNEMVREQLRKQIRSLVGTNRVGNRGAAVKRALASLPVNPQLHHESPYLDQAMFSYDEKLISGVDRPKPCYDQPVRFHLRKGGQLRFKLSTGPPRSMAAKRFVSYVFHPVHPFAMSLQQAGSHPPVVNIHFRQ
jgi:de-etiolated-1